MSGDSRWNRTILPRVCHTEDKPTAGSDTNPQARPPNIRSACLACRRRRSRCSGGNPCGRCRTLDTECVYRELQDGRYRASKEWGREQLELYRRLFNGLSRAVREGRELQLIEMIRSETSLESIAKTIDEMYPETGGDEALESTESTSTSARLRAASRTAVDPQTQPFVGFSDLTDGEIADLADYVGLDCGILRSSSLQQPLHLPPHMDTHNLSTQYINFRDTARQMLERGVSAKMILGNTTVSCSWLFSSQSPPFGVSGWATNIVNSIPGVDILFRLAWLCYLVRYMRWVVQPTEEHYKLMPPAMRPTAMQTCREHAAVIDLVPIPQIRDRMIDRFDDFVRAVELAGATVHWTEDFDDSIDLDPITGNRTISTKFENHIADINNFCFGKSLLLQFPELEGQPQIAEVNQIVSISLPESPIDHALQGDISLPANLR